MVKFGCSAGRCAPCWNCRSPAPELLTALGRWKDSHHVGNSLMERQSPDEDKGTHYMCSEKSASLVRSRAMRKIGTQTLAVFTKWEWWEHARNWHSRSALCAGTWYKCRHWVSSRVDCAVLELRTILMLETTVYLTPLVYLKGYEVTVTYNKRCQRSTMKMLPM